MIDTFRKNKMKEEEIAVSVKKAKKYYGKPGSKYILDDLNMTVKKGTM